jgi:hypothetical protein
MIDPNTQPQAPAIWASHVGRAAAAMPNDPLQPHPLSAEPSPVSRLALAAHLHHRARVKEESDRKLNANEFFVWGLTRPWSIRQP